MYKEHVRIKETPFGYTFMYKKLYELRKGDDVHAD